MFVCSVAINDLEQFLSSRTSPITIHSCRRSRNNLIIDYTLMAPPVPSDGTQEPVDGPMPSLGPPASSDAQERPLVIRPLFGPDLTPEFVATLEALSPVGLDRSELGAQFCRRLSAGIRTFVGVVVSDSTKSHNKAVDKVVATASLLLEPKFSHSGSYAGHIEDVAVHPGWQHCGYGRRIVAHALTEAWKLGCRKVTLNCVAGLESFYQQLGFVTNGIFMRADRPTSYNVT